MSSRIIGFVGMGFVALAALMLSVIIIRSPDTHHNLAPALRADYARSPTDSIEVAHLEDTLARLPEFTFPAPSPLTAADGDLAGSDHGELHKITVRQFEFGYDPIQIELEAGASVELTVVNEGNQVHGIWIPELGISEDIRSGRSMTFTFVVEKAGRIRFGCNYSLCGSEEEHAQMDGEIVVSG